MARRIFSIVYLLTGIVIGLGAFGHDSSVRHLTDEFAKLPTLDAHVAIVTLAVWHFCSGCMFVFGAICVWIWRRYSKGARDLFFASDTIGAFYIAAGLLSVYYTATPFFWLFVALGGLLIASGLVLRRS